MKAFSFVFTLVVLGFSSCERHEWESKPGKPGTEELFKHEDLEKKDGEEKKAH